jgi:hypothetical protein
MTVQTNVMLRSFLGFRGNATPQLPEQYEEDEETLELNRWVDLFPVENLDELAASDKLIFSSKVHRIKLVGENCGFRFLSLNLSFFFRA